MGYCVASGRNLLWVIVWRVVVICYGFFVRRVVVIFSGLLCGEWWQIVMGYCVASGGNLLFIM